MCVSALDCEFQESRELYSAPHPHCMQSAIDGLWIIDESQSWRRKDQWVPKWVSKKVAHGESDLFSLHEILQSCQSLNIDLKC